MPHDPMMNEAIKALEERRDRVYGTLRRDAAEIEECQKRIGELMEYVEHQQRRLSEIDAAVMVLKVPTLVDAA